LLQLTDNKKARIMQDDGTYRKPDLSHVPAERRISSQEECCKIYKQRAQKHEADMIRRGFIPEFKKR